jgi:hypothetical protein
VAETPVMLAEGEHPWSFEVTLPNVAPAAYTLDEGSNGHKAAVRYTLETVRRRAAAM